MSSVPGVLRIEVRILGWTVVIVRCVEFVGSGGVPGVVARIACRVAVERDVEALNRVCVTIGRVEGGACAAVMMAVGFVRIGHGGVSADVVYGCEVGWN